MMDEEDEGFNYHCKNNKPNNKRGVWNKNNKLDCETEGLKASKMKW